MRPANERGSALALVLVAVVVLSILMASILGARLQPALSAANAGSRAGADLAARAALARLTESWVRRGACASEASAGVACVSQRGGCTCAVGAVVVTAVPQGGAYALSVAAPSSP